MQTMNGLPANQTPQRLIWREQVLIYAGLAMLKTGSVAFINNC